MKNWLSSFSPEEQKELQQLLAEAENKSYPDEGNEKGVIKVHAGFFNNDDLRAYSGLS